MELRGALRWLVVAAAVSCSAGIAGRPRPLLRKTALQRKARLHRKAPPATGGAPTKAPPPPPKWQERRRHYWPQVRGNVGHYSHALHVAPKDLAASLLWKWSHKDGRFHTTVIGGPLIDDQRNLYVACEDGIRKFTSDGRLLWHYHPGLSLPLARSFNPDTLFTQVPALMGSMLFGSTSDGNIFGLDIETGEVVWKKRHAVDSGPDTAYVGADAGVVVAGVDAGFNGGGSNRRVVGLNATNGDLIWNYSPTIPVWNIMPMFGGDDTVTFMDYTGGVHCLNLSTGAKKWHTPPPQIQSFSDGGVILGPDNTAYTCSNVNGAGIQGMFGQGALRAYRHSDGAMMWQQGLPLPCLSWPAVSADGSSVVVSIGGFPLPVPPQPKESEVWSFNARTGKPKWHHRLDPWPEPLARADVEGLPTRLALGHRPACIPASWSAPTIDAAGSVVVGHESGKIYRIHNEKEDPKEMGLLDAAETEGNSTVSTFDAKAAFLHSGASFAKDMMAFATCDTVYVFKADQAVL